MRNFIDSLFAPALNFLNTVKANLLQYAVERNRPIDLDSFFSPFAMLGPNWVLLIKSVLLSLLALTFLFVALGLRGAYLYFKESIKWW